MASRCVNRRTVAALALTAVVLLPASGLAAGGSGGIGSAEEPVTPPESPQGGDPLPSGAKLVEARVRPRRAFFDGLRSIAFSYQIRASQPVDLRINIWNRGTQALERSFYPTDVESGSRQRLVWDGLDSFGRAADGELNVEISGVNGEALERKRKSSLETDFDLFGHAFPIGGAHSYGDGLGAGRNHGGQDLPAECGTGLVAARGGRVRAAGYEPGGAGNYVVINGSSNRLDYVYMHMRAPAPVQEGERIRTGQVIGAVGDTGRSFGCHLHFELWEGPWGTAGSRIDPLPALRRWDRYS